MPSSRIFVAALAVAAASPLFAKDPLVVDPIAAVVAGTTVPLSAVESGAESSLTQLRDQEYAARRLALEDVASTALLDREAKARKMTTDELLKTEVEAKISAVLEADKKAFYEENKARMGGKSYEETAPLIETHLRSQAETYRRYEFLRSLKNRYGMRLYLEPPRTQVSPADGPSLGPKKAPVLLVVFSDFQCPHCAKAEEVLRGLPTVYGKSLRIVFRNNPLAMHADAPRAAEAAACADEQKKFWPFHDLLFDNQDQLSEEGLKTLAPKAGLKAKAFAACLASGRGAARWKADAADAKTYGVTGTPTVFINGRRIFGNQAPEVYMQAIDDELLIRNLPLPGAPKLTAHRPTKGKK